MKRRTTKKLEVQDPQVLKEAVVPFGAGAQIEPMLRTQIYLSKPEYDFLQSESARRDQPMAAVIRSLIDEKMTVPESAWKKNPLLDEPADPDFVGPEDAAINHDHYLSGSPRKYEKVDGKWIRKPLSHP